MFNQWRSIKMVPSEGQWAWLYSPSHGLFIGCSGALGWRIATYPFALGVIPNLDSFTHFWLIELPTELP